MCILLVQLDTSGNGYIDLKELKDALDGVGYKIPQWKVRIVLVVFLNPSVNNLKEKKSIIHKAPLQIPVESVVSSRKTIKNPSI